MQFCSVKLLHKGNLRMQMKPSERSKSGVSSRRCQAVNWVCTS